MRLTLPEDFKASYRLHNGASGSGLLIEYPDFYPLSGVNPLDFSVLLQDASWVAHISQRAVPSQFIQPVTSSPQWLTFAGDGAGTQWCIDLTPGLDGTKGQVILWDHESPSAQLLFPNFGALLSAYADQLEAGIHVGYGLIVNVKKMTYLKERRTAFQHITPAKSLLSQAIRSAWEYDTDKSLDTFRQVLKMQAATPEDRFFAYYGLITGYTMQGDDENELPSCFAQLEADARSMPTTHWIHEEIPLLRD